MNLNNSINLTFENLCSARSLCITPFHLHLPNKQIFFGQEAVSIMPEHLLIAFGVWQDKPVVAKIFFNLRHGKSSMDEDANGIRLMQDNKILTSEIYYCGACEDKRIYVVLYERILNVKTFDAIWRNKNNVEEILPVMRLMIAKFAELHSVGIQQNGCNLKNYLIRDQDIYTIDGEMVEKFDPAFFKEMNMTNFANFLARMGFEIRAYIEPLFQYYAQLRGWSLKKEDYAKLISLIALRDKKGWQRRQRKIFENCTDFSRIKGRTRGVYDRSYASPEFIRFLSNPEIAFNDAAEKELSVKITLDEREFIVKRYQPKITLPFCPSRAVQAWRLAQKLHHFVIPIPKPVAFIEKKSLGFIKKSYYVSENFSGKYRDNFFTCSPAIMDKISEFFKNISGWRITFRDLKETGVIPS